MSAELAPIATEIIFEDERVRIWKQFVPANSTIEKHRHDHDYFLINLAGHGPFDVQFHDGTGGDLGERFTYAPKPKTADFVPKGHLETASNQGEDYHAILVELKTD